MPVSPVANYQETFLAQARNMMSHLRAMKGGGAGPYEDLCEAIREGDIDIVKNLLLKGVRVNSPDPEEDGPLHLAIKSGSHPDVIALLIEKGADVSARDEEEELPLMLAIESRNVEVAKMILDRGADVYVVDGEGSTPLHRAAGLGMEEIVRVLLEKELFVDLEDGLHYTPLQLAAKNGHEPIVKVLLAHGANLHEVDRHGRTALHHATMSGHCNIACRLIDYEANVDVKDNKGRTCLHDAAWLGHSDIAQTLLNFNSNINVTDGEGYTPLHHAALRGHEDVIALLMERGADLSIQDKSGRTPLHHVILRGNYDMIKLLIECSDDLNTLDNDNLTPLTAVLSGMFSTTVFHLNHDLELAELLIKHFVRIKLKSGQPIHDDDFQGLKQHLSDERWAEICSYLTTCAQEFTKIQKYKILDDSISLYDFLTRPFKVLVKYTMNEDAVAILNSHEWEDKFPIYSDFIKARAHRAVRKRDLLTLASNCLSLIAKYKTPRVRPLPDIPCSIILRNMTELDLRNLIKACFHPPG